MQWLEKVFKLLDKLFKTNAFKAKYKTKNINKLPKILNSNRWQIIDIRNQINYNEHHLEDTINLPILTFTINYYKKLDKSKNILIINNDYRSDLKIYKLLKKKGYKTYLLYKGYKDIRNDEAFDRFTKANII